MKSRFPFTESLAGLLALLLLASPAPAREGAGDLTFKQHNDLANSLYGDEQYEEAIKEFAAAFELKRRPVLLFNIGQSYRKLGRAEDALFYYRRYQQLEPNPKPGIKKELDSYIAEMESLVKEAYRLSHPDPAPPPPAPGPTSPAQPGLVDLAPANQLTQAPPPKPVYKRAWLWCVVGGVALTAVAVGLGVGLSQESRDFPIGRPFGLAGAR
jgi:tetratricopeptide (TPR) repeat protein